jgi:hypothetical protein
MNLFYWGFLGFFFGFFFGVGCALAVVYSIYLHGYRKAMEDSQREEKSQRYREMLPKVLEGMARAKIAAQKLDSGPDLPD